MSQELPQMQYGSQSLQQQRFGGDQAMLNFAARHRDGQFASDSAMPQQPLQQQQPMQQGLHYPQQQYSQQQPQLQQQPAQGGASMPPLPQHAQYAAQYPSQRHATPYCLPQPQYSQPQPPQQQQQPHPPPQQQAQQQPPPPSEPQQQQQQQPLQMTRSSDSSVAADTATAAAAAALAVNPPAATAAEAAWQQALAAETAPDVDPAVAKALRKQRLLQEKNRRAQARFRERQKVRNFVVRFQQTGRTRRFASSGGCRRRHVGCRRAAGSGRRLSYDWS